MPKRRLGDSSFNRTLAIRINDELLAEIRRIAEKKDWTAGLVVREAIRAGLSSVERMRNGGDHG